MIQYRILMQIGMKIIIVIYKDDKIVEKKI